jgi:diguanylate cyclase (GGDEF)-like protein
MDFDGNIQRKARLMDEQNTLKLEELIQSVPGGIAKLAFDDALTILYATDTFYSLIKNATEKAIMKAPIALLRIVYSADIIYVTQQLAAQKNRKDNMINFNFRTLQHNGSFKWVMVSGTRTEEVYQSGNKTVPVYSCIAMDVTYQMVKYKRLEQLFDYQRTVSELSRELFFEYEIATDTLSFTELFREVFGKDSEVKGFRKKLETTKLIYHEELPAIIKIFNSMMSGRKQARFELRLIPKNSLPVWYTCYASIIMDENKNPYKVVGKLAVSGPLTKEPDSVPVKPQLDNLTNVCTKDSAEMLIREVITKHDEDTLSALILIDIRNYNSFNEIRRMTNGENILTTIGRLLKEHFRTSDIIGRMGIGEFIVYLRDIPSDQIAFKKAEQICRAVDKLYTYAYTKSGMSVSIGIAFQKGVQKEYAELLANANTALVMAKQSPTSSFEVFNGLVNG